MSFEEPDKFLLKRPLLMMLRLIANVGDCVLYLGDPNTESSIPGLPLKVTHRRKLVVHPFGRTALDQLYPLGDGDRGRESKQHVNMVFDASDFDRIHAVLSSDAPHIGP